MPHFGPAISEPSIAAAFRPLGQYFLRVCLLTYVHGFAHSIAGRIRRYASDFRRAARRRRGRKLRSDAAADASLALLPIACRMRAIIFSFSEFELGKKDQSIVSAAADSDNVEFMHTPSVDLTYRRRS